MSDYKRRAHDQDDDVTPEDLEDLPYHMRDRVAQIINQKVE